MSTTLSSTVNWSRIRESILGERPGRSMLPDVRLPVLPQVISEFSKRADDPDVRIAQLAALVESDAGLTCQLLKIVNASTSGLKHRIGSAQHAITTLGIRKTRLCLVTAALHEALPARQLKLINLGLFWNTNLERACFAQRMATLFRGDETLAFAAGLLVDFLLPVLTNELESEYCDFLRMQQSQPIDLIDFEQQVFGWNHAEAGARVMFGWGFPDDLICCVLFHHQGLSLLAHPEAGKTTAAAVALASLAPDPLRQTPAGLEMLGRLSTAWKAFDLKQTAELVYEDYQRQALESANHIPLKVHCDRFYEALAVQPA